MIYSETYSMESLIPIVADLSFKYTGGDSTSIPYERAQQLMEAVLFCITAFENNSIRKDISLPDQLISPQKAYKTGHQIVLAKVKQTLSLYNDLMTRFDDYGNRCLHDTVIKGIPEFFKWYNVDFAPQEAILTLDYPVLTDLSQLEGIYKIECFLNCISKEQVFLSRFDREHIIKLLSHYDKYYRDMIENLPEIVKREMPPFISDLTLHH